MHTGISPLELYKYQCLVSPLKIVIELAWVCEYYKGSCDSDVKPWVAHHLDLSLQSLCSIKYGHIVATSRNSHPMEDTVL